MFILAFITLTSCVALYAISAAFRKLGDLFIAKLLQNVSALLLVVFAGAAVTGVVQQFDTSPSPTYETHHDDEEEDGLYYEEADNEGEPYEPPGYHYVDDYYRSDGTHVDGHWRSDPNEYEWDNINN